MMLANLPFLLMLTVVFISLRSVCFALSSAATEATTHNAEPSTSEHATSTTAASSLSSSQSSILTITTTAATTTPSATSPSTPVSTFPLTSATIRASTLEITTTITSETPPPTRTPTVSASATKENETTTSPTTQSTETETVASTSPNPQESTSTNMNQSGPTDWTAPSSSPMETAETVASTSPNPQESTSTNMSQSGPTDWTAPSSSPMETAETNPTTTPTTIPTITPTTTPTTTSTTFAPTTPSATTPTYSTVTPVPLYTYSLSIGNTNESPVYCLNDCNRTNVLEKLKLNFTGVVGFVDVRLVRDNNAIRKKRSTENFVVEFIFVTAILLAQENRTDEIWSAFVNVNGTDVLFVKYSFRQNIDGHFKDLKPFVCTPGYTYKYSTCHHLCSDYDCGANGECKVHIEANGTARAYCLCMDDYDYEYSGPRCEESSTSKSKKIAIVAAVLGTFCALFLIVIIVMCVRQRTNSGFKQSAYDLRGASNPGYSEIDMQKM